MLDTLDRKKIVFYFKNGWNNKVNGCKTIILRYYYFTSGIGKYYFIYYSITK